jgi:hypothetical protein
MAACATNVRESNVLKQHCNFLNVSHSGNAKKNIRPGLDWMIGIQKKQRICDKLEKLMHIFLKALEVKQLSLQAQNMTKRKI